MEFKLRLEEVLNLNYALKEIIDTENKVDTLFKFKLLGIMKSIESFVNNFELIREEKIREYGEVTEDGKFFISSENKEALEKFSADINSIINSEVTLNFEKLKAEDVFNKGVSADYLVRLFPIIEQ